jgi:hypothetical protein
MNFGTRNVVETHLLQDTAMMLARLPEWVRSVTRAVDVESQQIPFVWCASNVHLYSLQDKAVPAVLSAVPGTVASGQLFSTVSDI